MHEIVVHDTLTISKKKEKKISELLKIFLDM